MQVHFDLDSVRTIRRPVITIGSFDGVHRGHTELLQQLNILASRLKGSSTLITFEPHPRIALGKDLNGFSLLTMPEEKVRLLADTGLQHLVIIPFTSEFAAQDPHLYLEEFLEQSFHPKAIVIGHDHKFGKDRQGDIQLLKEYFSNSDVLVEEIDPVLIDQLAISSTRIRKAIGSGNMCEANRLLGHPYLVGGQIVKGDQIGRSIGFPTANFDLDYDLKAMPPDGVYAVRSEIGGQQVEGMSYIGRRPVMGEDLARVFEVNYFDFEGDLYGDYIFVEILDRIRGDMKLPSIEALQKQLQADKEQVNNYFNSPTVTA